MYDGFWKNGKKHGLGVFRPAPDEQHSRRHSNGWPSQAAQQQQLVGGQSSSEEAAGDATDPAAALATGAEAGALLLAAADAGAMGVGSGSGSGDDHLSKAGAHGGTAMLQRPQPAGSPVPTEDKVASTRARLGAAAHAKGLYVPTIQPVPSVGSTAPTEGVQAALYGHDRGTGSGAGAGSEGGTPAAAAAAGQGSSAPGSAAPRQLFVREYDMGRLARQDVYTAEEIKMIFGFLWAKKPNKVRPREWRGRGGFSGVLKRSKRVLLTFEKLQ